MPELDDDLVTELREQLDAEKEARTELIEELRASRKPEPEEKPTSMERMSRGHDQADERRRKAKEKGGDDG